MRYLFILAMLLLPAAAFGLGADHTGPVKASGWPEGLEDLVNAKNRVHGFFVNWTDVFFFAGDTAACNQFVEACAKLPETHLEVVLHPGKLPVQSPWDKKPRDLTADWKLAGTSLTEAKGTADEQVKRAGQYNLTVDIYLGGQIELKDLKLPDGVTVKSGGEIEDFVERHTKK
jgi:hypothetical protein